MQSGAVSDEQLEASFIGSTEFINDNGGLGAGWITSMYEKLLGRDPDQAGLTAWLNALNNGVSPSAIALGFAASPEREGQRITADYEIYLGRAPEAGVVAIWVNAFTHGVTNEAVVAGFVGSAESFQQQFNNTVDWVYDAFQAILGRAPDGGGLAGWVAALGS
jgi:hypothetical protein